MYNDISPRRADMAKDDGIIGVVTVGNRDTKELGAWVGRAQGKDAGLDIEAESSAEAEDGGGDDQGSEAWFRKMRQASPPVLATSACVESVKRLEKGVAGVVEDHEKGYLSSEQTRVLVFEEVGQGCSEGMQREELQNVSPEIGK
ncbi:hypothetical protein BKA70DRAFT_1236594 [Coprinopsis sp. MPI-PUGE-AT-0042]|nr:hypothetical protein BKA70DRAFT_1236594 [Coprinopsis sp. MPI-PUGE-AT-0042]